MFLKIPKLQCVRILAEQTKQLALHFAMHKFPRLGGRLPEYRCEEMNRTRPPDTVLPGMYDEKQVLPNHASRYLLSLRPAIL